MTQDDERFLKQLRATFKLEAEEHLAGMTAQVLQLEREQGPDEAARVVETLFREAHSLKGAARSVNLAEIERVCQVLERVLSALKRGELSLGARFFDAMSATMDGLARMLAHQVGDGPAFDAALPASLAQSLSALLAPTAAGVAMAGAQAMPSPGAREPAAIAPTFRAAPPAASPDTVRVATAKLESLMTQAEDLQALKFAGEHLADELQTLAQALHEERRRADRRSRHARVLLRAGIAETGTASLRNRRLLGQSLAALDEEEIFIKALADSAARLARSASQDRRQLASRVDRLHDDMKQVLMLPLSSLLAPMAKLVRDLAHDNGKEAELAIEGASLDVDRRILEQLKAPLVHLIRNAIDHGIEPPAERLRVGKPRLGRVAITVTGREGNRIELSLSDDGAGISIDKLRERALKMGLLTPRALAATTPAQMAELVFESGVSTSPILTDMSGHGLGLAIVREKVEGLGGSISVETPQDGRGTRLRIVLPATLATFRGLLVQAGGQPFVLPSRHVERVGRVDRSAIRRDGEVTSIELEGNRLPLAWLGAVLGVAGSAQAMRDKLQLVVAASGDKRAAFVVDEVVGDQEVMVKPLASPLRRVRHIAGATVLGAGRVVPLLNVSDLLKSALQPGRQAVPVHNPAASRPLSLLVAEDSPTSRKLLKEILENAGYRVSTAGDGLDALAQLQHGEFDLLVTDVEMPRLDGFGLTSRLRGDARWSELPVVLVTALDSRADKERGVEVGANAYIVKSGFQAGRLLETIRTLI